MLIYTVTNKVNGKQYVGQTIRDMDVRRKGHMKALRSGMQSPLYAAIRSYGEEAFEWTVVKECSSIDELNASEVETIKLLGTKYPEGYNLTDGGSNGLYSEESKQKMSEAHAGVPLSRKHREKISRGLQGNTNMLGRVHTEEAKMKISQAASGENNPFYGKKHSPEAIEKIRAAARRKRKVINNG